MCWHYSDQVIMFLFRVSVWKKWTLFFLNGAMPQFQSGILKMFIIMVLNFTSMGAHFRGNFLSCENGTVWYFGKKMSYSLIYIN